jgi:hypothetical protein
VAPQRAAEGGHPLEQVSVVRVAGDVRDWPGVDVLDPDAVVKLGLVGQAGQKLLGVYRHLVTLPGELAGELAEADVVAVGAGARAGVQRRCVLGY